jgi:hypothetical protein
MFKIVVNKGQSPMDEQFLMYDRQNKEILASFATLEEARQESRSLNQEHMIFSLVRLSLRELNSQIKMVKGLPSKWTVADTEQVLRCYLDPGSHDMPEVLE